MTKSALGLLAVVALVGLIPTATGHGAAAPREFDTRVLLDDDGALGYGGCGPAAEAGAPCPTADGLDILVLDVREAWLDDKPAIAFRMVTQTDGAPGGRGLRLTFTAGGSAHELLVEDADAPTTAASGFDLVVGPVDAFDGHPKAVDGWLYDATLGLTAGDQLTGITLASTRDGADDDVAPGGWFANGEEVPPVPDEPDPGALQPAEPGTYTLKGPAPLVTITPTAAVADVAASGNVSLRITNPLAANAQDVRLSVVLPGGVIAGLDRLNLTLDPGATREVVFRVAAGSAGGNATIVARTDLGGRVSAAIQVVVPDASLDAPGPATSSAAPKRDTPGLGWAAVGLAALAVAGVSRK